FGDGTPHGFHVVHTDGGGLRRLHEYALGGGFPPQGGGHLLRFHHLPVGNGDHVGVQTVRLGDIRPSLAEFSRHADNDLVALGEEVRHRCVHGAGAGGGEHQQVVRRPH